MKKFFKLLTLEQLKLRHKQRKQWKKNGLKTLKKHYKLLIVLLAVAGLMGTSYSSTITELKNIHSNTEESSNSLDNIGLTTSLSNYMLKYYEESDSKRLNNMADDYHKGTTIGIVEVGRSEGAFAKLVNEVASGSILIPLQKAVGNITRSASLANDILIIGGFILIALLWIFIVNLFKVVYKRMFMEARVYEKVPFDRLTYLIRVKKWAHASITLLIETIYLTLWQFTIIGSFKKYSYFAVPYIIAERPDLSAKETITLSRKMMNGHKWECFMLDLSFIGWLLLGTITLGITDLLFLNAYQEASLVEFYHTIRQEAINNQIEGSEVLTDTYLFEKADANTIREAYQDVLHVLSEPLPEIKKRKGIWRFIEDNLGLVLYDDIYEDSYRKVHIISQEKIRYQDTLDLKTYPRRLAPIVEKEHKQILESTGYYRHYSLSSMILIFFSVSFIGWLWEVSLHLIEDGKFVNRGIMFGPWLPIYGSGAVIILLLLFKARSKPVALFGYTIVVCGIVEYTTSYVLEKMHGMRWWDYSGYFLNINGRICAEGLLVFGIGAFAIVYFLAPMLDNFFHRFTKKTIQKVCIVLLSLFIIDDIYSSIHPNEGKGITDYQTENSSN